MMEFNDKQVERFNNNQTRSDSLFKISWTLTPDGDSVLEMLIPGKPYDLIELADIANAQMWDWVQGKLKQNQRIGNIFIFDDYPNAPIEQMIDALYRKPST